MILLLALSTAAFIATTAVLLRAAERRDDFVDELLKERTWLQRNRDWYRARAEWWEHMASKIANAEPSETIDVRLAPRPNLEPSEN